jgi:hypothetical protein
LVSTSPVSTQASAGALSMSSGVADARGVPGAASLKARPAENEQNYS